MKKSNIRLCAALLSIIFCMSCTGSPVSAPVSTPSSANSALSSISTSVPSSSVSDEHQEPERIFEKDPGYFIFLDNMLVGSYHDGLWHTIENRELSIADYLKQEAYYCYNQTELIGISKKLTFMYDSELNDSFANGGEPLIPYAQEHNGSSKMTFYLPLELPQDLRYIKSQTYNTNIIFNIEYSEYYYPLVLSTDFNPLPKTEIKKLPGPYSKDDQTAIKDELKRLGVPDAPVNMTESYDFDYNGDGAIEHFIVVNAPLDEWNYVYKYSPLYYMVLMKDKTGYNTITSWSRPNDDETANEYMELLGFFDLNNDGIFELCLYRYEWEGCHVYVYTLTEQNKWECVLTGSGGMYTPFTFLSPFTYFPNIFSSILNRIKAKGYGKLKNCHNPFLILSV